MKKGSTKYWIYTLAFAALSALVISLVYYIGSISVENPDTNLAARNIESPQKLLLNGYLGLFFGFKYLGNINWLLIPLFSYYLYKKNFKLSRAQWALVAFFSLAFVLIAFKGFFNFRYAFTLMTFCILMVVLLVNSIAKDHSKKLFNSLALILILCNLYGFQNEMLSVRARAKMQSVLIESKEEIIEEAGVGTKVENLLHELQESKIGDIILVNNLPDFYYHTNRKGLYYWSGDDLFYDQNGRSMLFKDRTSQDVKEFLASINCSHIYTHATYKGYHERFDQFLIDDCELEIEDEEGRQLYRVIYD